MPGSPPRLPLDEALPQAADLLDRDAAQEVLREMLDGAGGAGGLRVRYLAYRPGERLTVQYELTVDGGRRDAMAWLDARGAGASWYPADPGLPALADPAAVCRSLGLPDGPVRRLAWVPGERAALRVGDAVVKLYARDTEVDEAASAIGRVGGAVATPGLLGVDRARRAVAQRAVDAPALDLADAPGRAGDAAAVLRALRLGVDVDGLRRVGPDEVLDQAEAPVALASFARPELGGRLHAALDALRRHRPPVGESAAAHGDFNVGQLLDAPGGLVLVDLDTLCAAPAAFDLAAYATNVVSGRAADGERSAAARRALAAADPAAGGADMAWYTAATLLRRVDRAVRRLKRDWPERTDALVRAVEDAVAAVTA